MNVVQNNLISIVVLLILFLGIFKQVNKKDPVYKSFLILIGMSAGMLLLESLIFIVNDQEGMFVNILITSLAVLYHGMIPIILFVVFIFFDVHFYEKPYKPLRYIIPFMLIFVMNIILVIFSINNGYVFEVNSQNHYEAGSMYIHYESIIFSVFTITMIYAIIQRKKVDKETFMQLMLFIIPLLAIHVLIAMAGFTYVTWNAMAISLLIVYIFMQLRITATDYLTGLANRRGYEYLLFNLNKNKYHDERITGIMIDIDNFKSINDEFGHAKGDEALKSISVMLKKAVRRNDFVSRTGGDEFAIIIQSNEPNVGEIVVERINKELHDFNKVMAFGFKLRISIGCDKYDEKKHRSISAFFEHLDHEMYRDKHESERIFTS